MRSGSNHARSAMRFVKLPAVAAGTRAGFVISFMVLTLVPELLNREGGNLRL